MARHLVDVAPSAARALAQSLAGGGRRSQIEDAPTRLQNRLKPADFGICQFDVVDRESGPGCTEVGGGVPRQPGGDRDGCVGRNDKAKTGRAQCDGIARGGLQQGGNRTSFIAAGCGTSPASRPHRRTFAGGRPPGRPGASVEIPSSLPQGVGVTSIRLPLSKRNWRVTGCVGQQSGSDGPWLMRATSISPPSILTEVGLTLSPR